jgi:hypothetical protein
VLTGSGSEILSDLIPGYLLVKLGMESINGFLKFCKPLITSGRRKSVQPVITPIHFTSELASLNIFSTSGDELAFLYKPLLTGSSPASFSP